MKKSRFTKGIGGLPDSEIEKLKILRQVIDRQTQQAASKPLLSQEQEAVTERRFCQKAKRVPQFDPDLPFFSIDSEKLDASSSCVALARLAATASYNASSCFVLSWPAVTSHPSIAHVIATLSFYSIYKGQELRTLYWPAKTNTMNYLRRVCINAKWLREIAAQVATERHRERHANSGKTHFRGKTLALLRLKDLIKGAETPLPLSEYIPVYHYNKDGMWIRQGGMLLESAVKAVNKYKAKEMIRNQAASLDRPGDAVDSLFCLHPEMDLVELKLCIHSPVFDKNQGGMPPNLVFLDLRAANRFQTEKWSQKALNLFQHFQGKGDHAPTGIVILVDSPLVYENLRSKYENWHFPRDIALERYQPKFAAMVDTVGLGLVQQGSRISLTAIGKAAVEQQASQHFRVQVTDRQTALLVQRFLDLAHEVNSFSNQASKALYDVAQILSDFSMLPGGMKALEAWLLKKMEDDGWRELGYGMSQSLIWKKKAIALDDLMHEGELGNFCGPAKNLLNDADEYIQGIQHSTPAGKALEAALEDALKGREQGAVSLMVVVDRQHHFYLAENMLTDRFGAENKIQVSLVRELSTLEIDNKTELICLLSNHASIRHLFMLRQAPRSCRIIVGHRRAGKIMESLKVVLDISEYEKFHPLAGRLISQIRKGMVDIAIPSALGESIDWDESQSDMDIFDFSSSVYGNPRGKVIVRFAEHPPELFYPRSTVFLLDRDSSWGYRSETAMNLEKGDILLVIPKSITDQILERLEAVYSDKSVEAKNHVRDYQEFVSKRLEIEKQENNGTCSPSKISRKINEMAKPEIPVRPNNVRYWIGFEDSEESDMTTLVPHAPKTWEHFKAFSIYLELPESLAMKVFVQILMLRRHNQKEGRRSRIEAMAILADEYSYHDSKVYPTDFIQEVRDQAERHSFRIQQVFKPELPENDTQDISGDDCIDDKMK